MKVETVRPATIERYKKALKYISDRDYKIRQACRQAKISEQWFRKLRKLERAG